MVKMRTLPKRILMGLIRFYRRFISPMFPPCCRFYPTCSAYTFTAIDRFGAAKGIWLGSLRLLRCNPLFRGGIDPVPEKFVFFPRRESPSGAKEDLSLPKE